MRALKTGSSVKPETRETMGEILKPAPDDFLVVACGQCNVKNRVNKSRVSASPKCGKCGRLLVVQA